MVNLESFFESWIGIWMYKFVIFKVEILSFWTFPNFFQNKNNLMKTLARSFVCCATQWTIPCHFRQVLLPSARCLWVAGPKSWPSRELWSSSNTQLGWTNTCEILGWVGGLLVGFCHSYQRLSKWDSEWNDGRIFFCKSVAHQVDVGNFTHFFVFFLGGVDSIHFFRTWFPILQRFSSPCDFLKVDDPKRPPGDFENAGFLGVPNGYVKAPAGTKEKKLAAEIANGRLAMMAIIGMFFQNGLTGEVCRAKTQDERLYNKN